MSVYRVAVVLHLLAVVLWFGHMFFWTFVSALALKRIVPAETAATLRRWSFSMGGLGWPALAVLIVTGYIQLAYRGIDLSMLLSGRAFAAPGGWILGVKLALVGWMIVYQAVFGHRPAPRAVYVNIAAALAILALSIILVRPALWFAA